ncbi:hypothetical protein LJC08_04565 [Methanimicrococcus sp. OttesenSCG-928-J09]|nr:hypothetical protein [Methanimicrococcus sp. OttesenSCG-928-J09]
MSMFPKPHIQSFFQPFSKYISKTVSESVSKSASKPVFKLFPFLGNNEGVSTIFGALLLLAIAAVFISAFLLTAIPAQIMLEESEDSSRLESDIIRFSEQNNPAGSLFFQTAYTSVFADETADQIIFSADLTMPPETKAFLKTVGDIQPPDSSDDVFQSSDVYCLSSGSLLFLSKYSQIPDSAYSIGASSILLIQDDGFSFLKTPDISFRRGKDDQILLTMSGTIVKSNSSSVFGNRTHVRFFTIQSAEIYDSVPAIAFQFIPASNNSKGGSELELNEAKTEAFKKWTANFENVLLRDFPELEIETDDETLTLFVFSETPFDIDIKIREIEYDFSSGF